MAYLMDGLPAPSVFESGAAQVLVSKSSNFG